MPRERISMRKLKEVFRMKWGLGLSHRQIARSLSLGLGTVGGYVRRAEEAGLRWELIEPMSNDELDAALFPKSREGAPTVGLAVPDWAQIEQELRRHKGVTLHLLWQEFRESQPNACRYSWFCQQFRRWRRHQKLDLRQTYVAGEKLFVDFSGLTVPLWAERLNVEVGKAEIFVACLGASDLIFAKAVGSQGLEDWVRAHCDTFEFLGGAPEIVVPDNLKSGVTRPCRYDPDVNRTYWEVARHYGVAVIPARRGRPKDKAKVEQAVQMVQRWVLAPLRHRRFRSLAELNAAMAPLLDALNDRPMKVLKTSRQELFDRIERESLRPLPKNRFEIATWSKQTVGPDYHVQVEGHYYSVPYSAAGRKVFVRWTSNIVEVLLDDRRIASHARCLAGGRRHVTVREHMPPQHAAHVKWTPERITRWVEQSGPFAGRLAREILASRPHPQQGFRACLGLIRLGERFGAERLDAACRRALDAGTIRYRSVQSILKMGLDQQVLPEEPDREPVEHPNVRGPEYYQRVSSC